MDSGAAHFAAVIRAIHAAAAATTVEVLTPDFLRKPGAAEVVVATRPDVFNQCSIFPLSEALSAAVDFSDTGRTKTRPRPPGRRRLVSY